MNSLGNVLILGDDFSAFSGQIPDGYAACYPTKRVPDITRVEQMWWHKLLTETNSKLVCNHSAAASTVCNSGISGADMPNSFIRRIDKLIDTGYFEKHPVDTIIIFGGQNDDKLQVPAGTVQYAGWRQEDLRHFGPAYCYMLDRLKVNLPNKRIICLEDMALDSAFRTPVELACHHYRVDLVHLRSIYTKNGYPDCRGMEQISNQIQLYLLYA